MARAVLGLAITGGWVTGVYISFNGPLALIPLIVGVILLIGWLRDKRMLVFRLILPVLAFLLLGNIYAEFRYSYSQMSSSHMIGRTASFSGRISSDPKDHGKYSSFKLSPIEGGGCLNIFTGAGELYHYGNILTVAGTPERNKSGPCPTLAYPKLSKLDSGEDTGIMSALYSFRRANISAIKRMLPGDLGSLMSGLLLGSIDGMSPEARDGMQKSGTTHLVALSGYNVSLIILALVAVLRKRMSARSLWLVATCGILGFVLMSGSEPSISRAGLMAFLMLWASDLGRAFSFPHAALWTAALMLLWSPFASQQAGFILSFLSLLGISLGTTPIQSFLIKMRIPEKISEVAAMTIAAQISVAPVLLAIFGEISAWSLISNILILPAVPLVMTIGFCSLFCYWLIPILGILASQAARPLLAYQLNIIHFFGDLRGALRFSPTAIEIGFLYLGLALWWLIPSIKHAKYK